MIFQYLSGQRDELISKHILKLQATWSQNKEYLTKYTFSEE
jgi:hypothetical protein